MRVALHSEIRADAVDVYVERHRRIPDDLVEAFERIGIRDWTIWIAGSRLFHLIECDDWAEASAALRDEPADRAWQAEIGPYIEFFRDAESAAVPSPLARVWSLLHQRQL